MAEILANIVSMSRFRYMVHVYLVGRKTPLAMDLLVSKIINIFKLLSATDCRCNPKILINIYKTYFRQISCGLRKAAVRRKSFVFGS